MCKESGLGRGQKMTRSGDVLGERSSCVSGEAFGKCAKIGGELGEGLGCVRGVRERSGEWSLEERPCSRRR